MNEAWSGESWTMPKGGGSKTPQLDHFPLNTDMVEKQGGKKVILFILKFDNVVS